jgi:hypothetical protein
MGGFTMMGGMGMNPMMMGGMGMMPGLMPLMIMQQMMQMMQMLMMMMGQQQGGMPGGGFGGGMPGGGCGCGGVGPAMGNGYGFPGAGGGGYAPPYMPYGGGYPGGGGGDWGAGGVTGPQPWNPMSGNRLADMAASMNGRHFKPGQTKRCADFVSTMLTQSGTAPPGFRHQVSAAGLANYGRPVDGQNLRPGDVVFFGNTYRPGRYTHVGIYLGNGRFAHRPTANKPVKIDNLNSPYWQSHFTGGRRMQG